MIQNRLEAIKNELNEDTTLVAVSKTKPVKEIKSLYEIGHVDFGENKVQELVNKNCVLTNDINWINFEKDYSYTDGMWGKLDHWHYWKYKDTFM